MIGGLKAYPAYRDSGVPWLGQVPEHWEVVPAFAVYKPKLVKNTGMTEKTVLSLSYGRIIVKPPEKLHGLVPESFETYQIVDPGNIIIRTTDLQNDKTSLRVGHSQNRGIITSAYMCLETTGRVSNEFGYQFLNTYDLLKIIYGYGSGLRQNLDFGHIKRMPVLVPPKTDQVAIVRFLDYADRRVRHYIRAKLKLIKLLEEQKQAIIHRFVTRGVDTNVKLKPSGLEWLGDVPEHWSLVPLKWIARIIDGDRGPQYPKAGDLIDQGIPFLSSKTIKYGSLDFSYSNFITMETFKRLRAGKLQKNDLVITVRGTIGNSALFDGAEYETGFINAQMMILRPLAVLPPYLLALTQSYLFKELLAFRSYGSAQQQLTNQILASLPLPLPPVGEQNDLLAAISDSTITADRAIKRAGTEIELLREYRTRLIADVVTGKLDVREAAARLPVEVSKAEPLDEMDDLTQDEETAEDAELEAEETV
jgi:type I restriction enzyme S subunit